MLALISFLIALKPSFLLRADRDSTPSNAVCALSKDQSARRISLLGVIDSQQALLVVERAALPSKPNIVSQFLEHIYSITNLGANDIYHWYMANHQTQSTMLSPNSPSDLKLNLIYPCTEKHIRKYSAQRIHMVHETSQIYAKYVRPFIDRERSSGRLNWMYNIIEGRSEQEDVILRSHEASRAKEGFLLLPDLNWDRETMDALHLLAIVERRDIASLRDLQKQHVDWLRTMQKKVLQATVSLYGDRGIEEDGLKLYVHCKSSKAF